jgi:membrane-bound metal-dependent hydrolase YbcI (DUF457 family)
MFPLGHVGIGARILPARLREALPSRWLGFGCLLPDVIDKPIFVAVRVARRLGPVHFDLLRGSRLFGHTLLLLALLSASAALVGSARLRALAWGAATHLVLDLLSDLASGALVQWRYWLLWPLFGLGFPPQYTGVRPGGVELEYVVYLVGDAVGTALLLRTRPRP